METSEYLVLAIFILSGSVSLAASVCNSDWFFQSQKASTFVNHFGRRGARLFYGLIGVALIAAGALFFFFGYRP